VSFGYTNDQLTTPLKIRHGLYSLMFSLRLQCMHAIGAEGEQSGYTYLAGSSSFTNAILTLKNHVASRRTLISGYVP